MRVHGLITLALVVPLLAACGDLTGAREPSQPSQIVGTVHLGPQCPAQTDEDPCADQPARGATVRVARQTSGGSSAGTVVARTTTDARGVFRVAVDAGAYVVTADAGMSCELVDVTVTEGARSTVDVACDTGIR